MLGSQNLRNPHRPFSEFAEAEGINYQGFDWNGEDGCLNWDLCRPLPEEHRGVYDLVLNFGTTEHCYDQDAVFENIDQMCKPGGAFVHVVPADGYWVGHAPLLYSREALEAICERYGYEVAHLAFRKLSARRANWECIARKPCEAT